MFVSHAYAAHAHQSTPSTSKPFCQPGPGRVLDDETGHLRDGEDEDQVEEELEWCDALLCALTRAGLHLEEPILAEWESRTPSGQGSGPQPLSGAPSTLHALATGRDPLEATARGRHGTPAR